MPGPRGRALPTRLANYGLPPASARLPRGDAGQLRPHASLLVTVSVLGGAVLFVAVWTLASAPPPLDAAFGILGLLVAAALADAIPIPVGPRPGGEVSLTAAFVVGTALLYGWAEATLLGLASALAIGVYRRRSAGQLAYDAAASGSASAAAGLAVAFAPGSGTVVSLLSAVVLGCCAFAMLDVLLLAAHTSSRADDPFFEVVRRTASRGGVPLAIMSSVSLMLAVLWERSPVLAAALAGPLVAIVLYQRSVQRALAAMRLALTDPLTGLGNHRHFHERLEIELHRAEMASLPVTLCLLDVDELKRINDTHGHVVGDRLLAEVAGGLRHGGEAFRVGGDEFAVLLPGRDEAEGLIVAQAVVARLRTLSAVEGEQLGVSAGVATYPSACADRNDLYRAADEALYRSKRERRGVVHAYRRGGDGPPLEPAATA